ncbi:protein FAR1-RELATED SEQUENCE 5-like [Lolium perenne]|uniref:protein FAR1-RELATED SEQUENCE 5-like n=1 Tax=Lolium perenne TaxID=4522 RepID=UPI003A99031B
MNMNMQMEVPAVTLSDHAGSSKTGTHNEGGSSIALSSEAAYTEITLPESSGQHTPPRGQNIGNEANPEVVSTPHAPTASMRFDTLEDAQRHYLAFARRRGFGIRYNYRKKSEVTGELIRAAMVCHKSGHQAKTKEDTQKPNPVVPERMKNSNVRTDCPARMALKVRNGSWLVTEFCDEHNHPLLLKWSLTGFLRSHKDIPQEDQDFIRILHSVNMETSRMMQVMATLYESVEGVPYTPKELANFRSTLRAKNKYTDMQDTMAYFEATKLRDKDFYYRYKLDDEDRVQYLFWVDSAARKAYKSFNDCVSFDATYMTNKYKMPFAPFIGINNHGQSIQLGCGFLKNELSESYIWLFESFLIAMDGVAPTNMITDQDGSMRAAMEKVFPNTTHRNCRWHIVDKATEEVGPFVAKIPGLREEMNDCINCSLTPEEFETRWTLMINKFNIQGHEKIAALYKKRSNWVPAYFMHKFYPFLQTTQRSEGFNAVLKKYITSTNSVIEFVQQYEDIQAKIMKAENKEESDSSLLTAKKWCWHPIEQQVEKLYTKNIYHRFQFEMQSSMSYNIKPIGENRYEVYCITKFVPQYHNRAYEVYADPPNENYRCTCCKFERDGIVCCHILKAMVQLGVCEFPLKYVLRRWTWSAQENLVEELPGQPAVMPEESRKKMWLSVNCNEFKGLAMCGNETEDGRKIVRMHMKAMKKDLAALKRETEKRAKKVATSSATDPAENPSTQTAQANCPTQQVPPQVPSTGPRARKPPCRKRKSTKFLNICGE